MSEEKIIKIIKDICCYSTLSFETNEKCIQAIQGLLDLYQKEKEKNKKLKARKYMYNAETGEVTAIPIDNNYISKDKIKAKIEYYKGYENLEIYEHYNYGEIIQVLQELLEESESNDI